MATQRARKAPTTAEQAVQETAEPVNVAIETGVADDAPVAIETLLAELPAEGAELWIYRAGAGSRRDLAYLDRCDPGAFSLDWLRREYGGGRFRLVLRDERGGMLMNRAVEIEGRPRIRGENDDAPGAAAAAVRHEAMMERLMDRVDALARAPAAAAPAVDPVGMMTAMVQAIAALQSVVPKPTDTSDKMLEVLLEGMQLGRESAARSDEGGLLGSLGSMIGPAITAMREQQQAAGQQAPAPAQAPAVTNPQLAQVLQRAVGMLRPDAETHEVAELVIALRPEVAGMYGEICTAIDMIRGQTHAVPPASPGDAIDSPED